MSTTIPPKQESEPANAGDLILPQPQWVHLAESLATALRPKQDESPTIKTIKALGPSLAAVAVFVSGMFLFNGSLSDLKKVNSDLNREVGVLAKETENLGESTKKLGTNLEEMNKDLDSRLSKVRDDLGSIQGDLKVVLSRLPKAK